ncbi:hypothetical protein D3C85_1505180 [compost metagenome]
MEPQLAEHPEHPSADRLGSVGERLVEKHRAVHWVAAAIWGQYVGEASCNDDAGEGFLLATGLAGRGFQYVEYPQGILLDLLGVERHAVARIE